MKHNTRNSYAFIDNQNINLNIRSQWWKLDLVCLRVSLKEKYGVIYAPTKEYSNIQYQNEQRGALLFEILIVLAVLVIILGVGAQAVLVSTQSSKVAGERDASMRLAAEALEAARAVAEEKWQNIYALTATATPATTHYRVATTTVGWTIAMGDETILLNDAQYTRYLTIENACRATASREVTGSGTSCAGGSALDPGTQKIAVVVIKQGGDTVTLNEYFFRWKNKVCVQTDWSAGVGSGAKNCPDSTYGSAESSISTAGGILKLQ